MNDNEPEITVDDELDSVLSNPLDFTCTCNTLDPEDHKAYCKLWDCWEFEHQWYVWDPDRKELVDTYDFLYAELDEDDKSGKLSGDTTKTWSYTKCRHFQEPFNLPNGVVVYASSCHSDRQKDPIPDLGVYLSGSWTPDTLAYHIGCPDYGIPKPTMDQVLHVADEALDFAEKGKRVEVGCIGGHGRTGLFLAVLTVVTMDKPDGKEAVEYVRKNYCHHAVESELQEWYVRAVAAELRGEPWPERPAVKTYSYTYSTPTATATPVSTSPFSSPSSHWSSPWPGQGL